MPNLKEYTGKLNGVSTHPEYLELVHNRELVSKETIYKLAHRGNSPIVKVNHRRFLCGYVPDDLNTPENTSNGDRMLFRDLLEARECGPLPG